MASLDYKSDVCRIERCENERLDAEEQAEVIFNKFIQLKDLFEACFTTGVERQLHMEFRYNDSNAVIDSLRHKNMLKGRENKGLKHCAISEPGTPQCANEEAEPRRDGHKSQTPGDMPVRRLSPEGDGHEVVCQSDGVVFVFWSIYFTAISASLSSIVFANLRGDNTLTSSPVAVIHRQSSLGTPISSSF
ncbi:hypothetical protein SDJN02_07013, partial [Cucurbita argyrosperma subsp. argyrosperma]